MDNTTRSLKASTKLNDSLLRLREHFFGIKKSSRTQSELDKKITCQLIFNGPGKTIPVPTYTLDEVDKFDAAIKNMTPAILKGAALDWKCMKRWSPDFLKKEYGETEVPLLNPDMRDTGDLLKGSGTTDLKTIIDCLLNDDKSKYARFNNLLHIHPELIEDLDKEWFLKRRGTLGVGAYYSLFIGAKGTKTNLHGACSNNLFLQVLGKKHWTIIDPKFDAAIKPAVKRTPYFMTLLDPDDVDKKEYPAAPYIDKYECVLEAGDILYNPSSWWHKVTNLSPSIGMGFRWFNPNVALRTSATQTLQFVTSTNPSLWQYMTQGKSFSKILAKSK